MFMPCDSTCEAFTIEPVMCSARTQVFSCERDRVLREFVRERFAPLKGYTDMTRRCNTDAENTDDVDLTLYVAGIACQSFSAAGKNLGIEDTADGGRGCLFGYALDFITERLPRSFIIENVENLVRGHADTFNSWVNALCNVGGGFYSVHWSVLSTDEHGVPQRRRRVYVVGIRKDMQKAPFVFPDKVEPLPLDAVLDDTTAATGCFTLPTHKTGVRNVARGLEEIIKRGCDPAMTPAVIDHGASRGSVTFGASPTLTASRAMAGGFWLLHKGRTMTLDEMMRLQGMRPSRFKLTSGMRPSAMAKAVGNAMSGNVLHRVIARIAWALGMDAVRDQWSDPPCAAALIF